MLPTHEVHEISFESPNSLHESSSLLNRFTIRNVNLPLPRASIKSSYGPTVACGTFRLLLLFNTLYGGWHRKVL